MKNLLNIFASFAIITSAFAQPPERPFKPDSNAFIEQPDRRTFFSKTFYNASDNTYKTTIGAGYLHYLSNDGTFKDIDTNLRLDESGAYYVIDNGLYNVAFAAAIGQGNWDVAYEVPRPVHEKFRQHGKPAPPITRIRWKILSYGYFDQSRNRYQIIDYAKSVPPVVAGSAISYPEIFNGINVRYACDNTRLKEEIVLSQSARNTLPDPSKLGLSRNNSYFVVAMEYLLTPNNTKVVAKAANGRVPVDINKGIAFNGDEPIDFEDETGIVPFFFQKDYAHAAADSVTDFANRTSVKRIFYSLGGKYLLLVGIPWNWVNSSPQGDLIIDPTTTAIGNDDVYLQDANNYGTNSSLIIGKSSGTNKKRTIIKFDVSSISSGATIVNAQMKLRYYGVTGSPWVDRWVQAHQLLVNWNETQATRDVRLTGTNWALQYGAINGTDAKAAMESSTLFKVNEFPVWKNWDLTTLTQNWVNGSVTNYGVILWATNEDNDGMNLWFRSSEYSDPNFTPRLEVTWSTSLHAVYFLKDHLGSVRATVYDSAAAVIGYDDYDAWGYPLAARTKAIPTPYLQGGSKIKFTGKEYDDEVGLNLYYFDWRRYDPLTGRMISVDPLGEYDSPYVYVGNNPVNLIDPTGLRSTHTDSSGKVIAVYNDNDLGVYKHNDATTKEEVDKKREESATTSGDGTRMGETEFWDEFINPKTGEVGGQIVFGASWEEEIENKHQEAMKMNLIDIAKESKPGGKFDIKVGNRMEGRLLNGKYVTARSAGNYLAAYNARHGTLMRANISYTTFLKLAGALHQRQFNYGNAAKIVLFGTSYGPPPLYGEIEYAGRMFPLGWNRRK